MFVEFLVFEGAEDFLVCLTAVCCTLLPPTPTESPTTTTGMSVRPRVHANIHFRGYLQLLCISLVRTIRVTYVTEDRCAGQLVFVT
jgi:hypothetical protein